MKIAVIMNGERESIDHIILANVDELQTFVKAFTFFCRANKRKRKAAKILQQFDNELQIY